MAPLELVLRISLVGAPAVDSTIYPWPILIVFGVCFIGLGRGKCRGDVEQKEALNVIKPVAEQICGSRISTPGKSMAAAVAKLLFAGAPTTGMQAAQQSFFFPFYTSATPSASKSQTHL